ncbi:hypothetical protein [Methylobacterium isbiliense]|jgi:hypothetical protein|nr:hypothetical protein [Methylobacterium isbiliense]
MTLREKEMPCYLRDEAACASDGLFFKKNILVDTGPVAGRAFRAFRGP